MTKTITINNKKRSQSRVDIAKNRLKKTTSRSKSAKSRKKTRSLVKKTAKVALIMSAFFLLLSLLGTIYGFVWLQDLQRNKLPSPEEVFPDAPLSSRIYDRKGTELYKVIGDFNSDPVDINNVPEKVKWAFLAGEDVDFYSHDGFDTAGILRCGINYLREIGTGNLCGGSTITQQLIKNTALADETSRVRRKIKELFLSTQVEQQNNKDEILQMYLTVTSYGGNIVGIETAADYYFDKDPVDLTLAEAAILASIVQNPSYLSPTKPVDGDTEKSQARVKARQEYILGQIEANMGKINSQILENERERAKEAGVEFNEEEVEQFTKEMIEEARVEELTYQPPIATDKLAGHFVDFVLKELQTKNYKNGEEPFSAAELQTQGYRITTTLDYQLQQYAEDAAYKGGTGRQNLNVYNAAVMTLQPSTGQILTMAGSRSFTEESQACDENGQNCKFNPEVNILTSLQEPGSTAKSLAYYVGYEKGLIFPGSFLPDVPIQVGSYRPKNWNGVFTGVDETHYAQEMLRSSLNIPALIVMEMIGVESYAQTARDFGYTTFNDTSNMGISTVLGGTSVYLYEHAAAHSVFANQGDYVAPESILRIEDENGNVIYEANPQRERVASPQATYLLNQSLYKLNWLSPWDNRDYAAKTGTSEENKDNLIVAWSPDFVTVGWVGNNNNDPMAGSAFPITTVNPWLSEYMRNISGAEYFTAKTPFQRPGFVYLGGGECNENNECLGYRSSWLIEGKTPPSYLKRTTATVCTDTPEGEPPKLAREIDIALGFAEERTFYEYTMPVPSWQGFLDTWLEDNGYSANGLPKEICNIDRSGGTGGPVVAISAQPVRDGELKVLGVVAGTNSDVRRVEIFLNGTKLGEVLRDFNSVEETYDVSSFGLRSNVSYNLRIVARDASGNQSTTFVEFRVITSGSSGNNGSNNDNTNGDDLGQNQDAIVEQE